MEVLKKIKADKNISNISVIIMTIVDDLPTAVLCMEEGAQTYILKSVGLDQLLKRLEKEIERGLEIKRQKDF